MFIARVNNSRFTVATSDEGLLINDQKLDWDIVQISEGYFHIVHNQRSYRAEVVKADTSAKAVTIKINGKKYEVIIKDRFDQLLEKLGMNSTSGGTVNSVKAPMPGKIVELKVAAGDQVNMGDPLLILEAMKMENILKASGQATVKSVKVKRGESVEKGQVLIEF
ncbi:MAG: acetyl-CoA carboxylase biotin carboxyl carrier protein subunit [Cyclobacteriaceae bacterium]